MSHVRQPLSLRSRLAGTLAGIFAVGMIVLFFAARSYGASAADRSFDRVLAGSAISIMETVAINDDRVSVDVPFAAMEMLSAAPDDRVFYAVTGPHRKRVTGYGDLPSREEKLSILERQIQPEIGDRVRFFDAPYRGETVRFALVGRAIVVRGVRGLVEVQVGQTRLAREAVARDTVLSALLPMALVMVLALAVLWFGADRALRPVRSIGDDIAGRAPTDLEPIDATVPSELRPFVEATNGFMRRLSANTETLKSFIADASHQMRTPLAALLAQVQAASDSKPRELRRSLEAIERNAIKLSRLLNQLLSDATVAHWADGKHFEDMDLRKTLQDAVREAAVAVEGSDVRLKTRITNAPLFGDHLMLMEALKNVIDNAMRHGILSPIDGSNTSSSLVEIELLQTANAYRILVCDRGPGIPLEDRERVFDRFARVHPDTPGAGIGLSIVRRAIEIHNGKIELLDRQGGGMIFSISLPHR